jgi:formamidopyrimidine-DNA glycosylase
VRVSSPFLLRSVQPPLSAAQGQRVVGVERVGKRVVIALDGDLFLVLHLMVAGRLHWHAAIEAGAGRVRFRQRHARADRGRQAAARFSGIGNAYSDEILHRAGLSPLKLTRGLDGQEAGRLLDAARAVLAQWTERLRAEASAHAGWPPKVTAFHPQLAVHGRCGRCARLAAAVQRIVNAHSEFNYCPRCPTGGKLLADRALSRLLHASRPRLIDDIE